METVMQVLSNLFEWDNILFFVLGCVATIVFDKLKGRWMDKKFPKEAPHQRRFNVRHIIMAVAAIFAIFVFVQSTTTQIDNRKTAIEVNDCVLSFTDALSYRTTITTKDTALADRLEQLRRDDANALRDALTAVIAAPPGPDQGKVVNDALQGLTRSIAESDQERAAIDRERAANAEERRQNPYPEPSCGITTS